MWPVIAVHARGNYDSGYRHKKTGEEEFESVWVTLEPEEDSSTPPIPISRLVRQADLVAIFNEHGEDRLLQKVNEIMFERVFEQQRKLAVELLQARDNPSRAEIRETIKELRDTKRRLVDWFRYQQINLPERARELGPSDFLGLLPGNCLEALGSIDKNLQIIDAALGNDKLQGLWIDGKQLQVKEWIRTDFCPHLAKLLESEISRSKNGLPFVSPPTPAGPRENPGPPRLASRIVGLPDVTNDNSRTVQEGYPHQGLPEHATKSRRSTKSTGDTYILRYIDTVKKLNFSEPTFKELEEATGVSVSTWRRRFKDVPWMAALLGELRKRQSQKYSKTPEAKELMEYAASFIENKIRSPQSSRGPTKNPSKPNSKSNPLADLTEVIDEEEQRGAIGRQNRRDNDNSLDE